MSELRAATISNLAGTGPVDLTGQSAAKSWINFNGTGTAAIRDDLNVASLTDNAVGNFTVNFSGAFSSANYCATTNGRSTGAGGDVSGPILLAPSTTAFAVHGFNLTPSSADLDYMYLAVHGGLA